MNIKKGDVVIVRGDKPSDSRADVVVKFDHSRFDDGWTINIATVRIPGRRRGTKGVMRFGYNSGERYREYHIEAKFLKTVRREGKR